MFTPSSNLRHTVLPELNDLYEQFFSHVFFLYFSHIFLKQENPVYANRDRNAKDICTKCVVFPIAQSKLRWVGHTADKEKLQCRKRPPSYQSNQFCKQLLSSSSEQRNMPITIFWRLTTPGLRIINRTKHALYSFKNKKQCHSKEDTDSTNLRSIFLIPFVYFCLNQSLSLP